MLAAMNHGESGVMRKHEKFDRFQVHPHCASHTAYILTHNTNARRIIKPGLFLGFCWPTKKKVANEREINGLENVFGNAFDFILSENMCVPHKLRQGHTPNLMESFGLFSRGSLRFSRPLPLTSIFLYNGNKHFFRVKWRAVFACVLCAE